jgi:hypothetical protein
MRKTAFQTLLVVLAALAVLAVSLQRYVLVLYVSRHPFRNRYSASGECGNYRDLDRTLFTRSDAPKVDISTSAPRDLLVAHWLRAFAARKNS